MDPVIADVLPVPSIASGIVPVRHVPDGKAGVCVPVPYRFADVELRAGLVEEVAADFSVEVLHESSAQYF